LVKTCSSVKSVEESDKLLQEIKLMINEDTKKNLIYFIHYFLTEWKEKPPNRKQILIDG